MPEEWGGKNKITHLYMSAWEGRSTQSFLRFIHHFASWDAKYKGCLISSSSHGCYPITTLPSPMYSFTRVQKIQLHHLVLENEIEEGSSAI